jgi:hypothetical protein
MTAAYIHLNGFHHLRVKPAFVHATDDLTGTVTRAPPLQNSCDIPIFKASAPNEGELRLV